jgi:hypothetical protein
LAGFQLAVKACASKGTQLKKRVVPIINGSITEIMDLKLSLQIHKLFFANLFIICPKSKNKTPD